MYLAFRASSPRSSPLTSIRAERNGLISAINCPFRPLVANTKPREGPCSTHTHTHNVFLDFRRAGVAKKMGLNLPRSIVGWPLHWIRRRWSVSLRLHVYTGRFSDKSQWFCNFTSMWNLYLVLRSDSCSFSVMNGVISVQRWEREREKEHWFTWISM